MTDNTTQAEVAQADRDAAAAHAMMWAARAMPVWPFKDEVDIRIVLPELARAALSQPPTANTSDVRDLLREARDRVYLLQAAMNGEEWFDPALANAAGDAVSVVRAANPDGKQKFQAPRVVADTLLARIDAALAQPAPVGMVKALERQEGLARTYRQAQLTAEEKLCRAEANAEGWKKRAEYLEKYVAALRANEATGPSVAEAVAKERERCAKIADDFEHQESGRAYDKRQEGRDDNFNCARASAAKHIATAIRAIQGTDQ